MIIFDFSDPPPDVLKVYIVRWNNLSLHAGADLVAGPAYKLKQAGVALFCIGVEPDSETPEEVCANFYYIEDLN